MNGIKLVCGCIRGEFLCPEAEARWRRATDAYNRAKRINTTEAWLKYKLRRQGYDNHYKIAP